MPWTVEPWCGPDEQLGPDLAPGAFNNSQMWDKILWTAVLLLEQLLYALNNSLMSPDFGIDALTTLL